MRPGDPVQNVFNGLCGCYFDSIPGLFISGQVFTNYVTRVSTPSELA